MKWYLPAFDVNWVRCRNFLCREYFTLKTAKAKRKCPVCGTRSVGRKVNNKGTDDHEKEPKINN